MLAPYIPARDSLFSNWASNFQTVLAANPTTYGLLAADATIVTAIVATWTSAYATAVNPATRTPTTVQAKVNAKLAALATLRPYAQQIANNAGVSAPNKIAIGVNPRTSVPTPVAAPATNPIISIPSMINLGHVVRYRDSLASPTTKGKPAGAVALQLYCNTSATVVTDPTTLTFAGLQTKAPFTKLWDSTDAGKLAYYAGRWVTRRGLVGPWSPIVSATVPA